jgi:hypothetical protein
MGHFSFVVSWKSMVHLPTHQGSNSGLRCAVAVNHRTSRFATVATRKSAFLLRNLSSGKIRGFF